MTREEVRFRAAAPGASIRRRAVSRLVCGCAVGIALVPMRLCHASEIAVELRDPAGHAVASTVITLVPAGAARLAPQNSGAARPTALMDQQHRSFVPQVLVVASGTEVSFPNSDSVSHQVYSFSPAKRFQLALYKGQAAKPVIFDQAGIVVLGCNIHDDMVGYIVVTDAARFGTTAADGTLVLKSVPEGDYRLSIWSPYIADPPETLVHDVHAPAAGLATARFQLARALRAQPTPGPRPADWDY
jgi:plastocyanin